MSFADRVDAGRCLAARLEHLRGQPVVVLGLPRGGVPVAYEVARALDAPLDVIVVRKLGVPFQPELGMGAIGEDGVRIINDEIVGMARISESDLAAVEARERAELERRARRFRGDRPRIPLTGRTAVIVDDGIATGSTARAACQVARAEGAARVVLATPVAPAGWAARIGQDADECIALDTPEPFWAIGQFYADFSQTSDDEVVECLARAAERAPATAGASTRVPDDPQSRDEEVEVHAGPVRLGGHLTLPHGAVTEPGADIAAVVSRGGRPDLAGQRLEDVVLDLNRRAQAQLRCESRLAVVPGATHLFEEPGTLQAAAGLARDWFTSHLAPRPHRERRPPRERR